MAIGVGDNPAVLGLVGWQWVYIVWGIPAVVLGFVVLAMLTDWPHQARWLADDERAALEAELDREKEEHRSHAGHMTVIQALAHPKVLALAAAYFFVVTGNYGVELYMASILKDWYGLEVEQLACADRHPAGRLADRPAFHRLELGPDARAAVACVAADHLRRDRPGADARQPRARTG